MFVKVEKVSYEIALQKVIKRVDNAKRLAKEKYKTNKEQGKYEDKSTINRITNERFKEFWD